MGGEKLSEAEKEGLSPEEIAAIEEDDEGLLDELKTGDDDLAAEEAAAKADAEAETKAKAEQEAKDKAEEEAKAKEKADADAKAAAEEKTPEELKAAAKAEADAAEKAEAEKVEKRAEEPPPFVPQVKIVDDGKLEELKTKYEEAKKKFDDGDIDYAEMDEAKDEYNQAKWKKEYAEESNASLRNARWEWEQESFLGANKMFMDNETLHVAFVAAVNKLIVSDEGKTMSDRDVLRAAKEKVEKDLGMLKPADDKGTDKEKEKQEAIRKAKEKMGDKGKIPPDIGGLPEAEENTDENEFSYLDRLEGDAYQRALDRLTPSQLERYENAH